MGTATYKEIRVPLQFSPMLGFRGLKSSSLFFCLHPSAGPSLSLRSIRCCAALPFGSLPAANLVSAWPLYSVYSGLYAADSSCVSLLARNFFRCHKKNPPKVTVQ